MMSLETKATREQRCAGRRRAVERAWDECNAAAERLGQDLYYSSRRAAQLPPAFKHRHEDLDRFKRPIIGGATLSRASSWGSLGLLSVRPAPDCWRITLEFRQSAGRSNECECFQQMVEMAEFGNHEMIRTLDSLIGSLFVRRPPRSMSD